MKKFKRVLVSLAPVAVQAAGLGLVFLLWRETVGRMSLIQSPNDLLSYFGVTFLCLAIAWQLSELCWTFLPRKTP